MPLPPTVTYHRPATLDAALTLLREGRGRALPLAGGTALLGAPPRDAEALVDLGDLGLNRIEPQPDGGLTLGATATLADLMASEATRRFADGRVAEAARYGAGSLVRRRATLGGTLLARATRSDLVAVLLALRATVTLVGEGEATIPLADFYQRAPLLPPATLLTAVQLPALPPGARLRWQRVARSPMDQPILAVAARVEGEAARIGASGFPDRPRQWELQWSALADGDAADWLALQLAADLPPQGDALASAEFRAAMLPVLARRAMGEQGLSGNKDTTQF